MKGSEYFGNTIPIVAKTINKGALELLTRLAKNPAKILKLRLDK